jgi:hypothetical protein
MNRLPEARLTFSHSVDKMVDRALDGVISFTGTNHQSLLLLPRYTRSQYEIPLQRLSGSYGICG